jgi:A/G-specific adenine glycosylase
LAYAYNQPVVFVETNIRTVYIHHFTRDGQIVSDDFIRDLVSSTIDRDNPREFYWALMDYGSHLKTLVKNNHRSKHYVKQSPFQGSRRQVRGGGFTPFTGAPV